MNIAILGYGRMGKTIERLAIKKGHNIVCKTSKGVEAGCLENADVAIDFSIPEAAFENISLCIKNGVPVVSGTTGWLDKYKEAEALCKKHQGAFIYASNFSIGVNLFFQINQILADKMKNLDEYKLSVEEIHHTGKRDKPSGTAISIAEDIVRNSFQKGWELVEHLDDVEEGVIPVKAKRFEDVKGTHIVEYKSTIDSIEIKHTAFSRDGFAKGAILAAEFIKDKQGVFGMKEVLRDLI